MVAERSPDFKRIRLVLGRSAHFRALPPETLDRLAAMARIRRYEDGELVHAAWQPIEYTWIVLRGAVRITMPTGEGTDVPIMVAAEGAYYGVTAVVADVALDSEGRCVGPTDLAQIDIERLRGEVERDRALSRHIMGLLGARLRAAVGMYRDAISAPLRERMARRLVSHALSAGRDADGAGIELRLSQGDLADMLGASRSKVNAELRRLEGAGTVQLGYKRIVVRDLARLRADARADVVAI